MTQQQIYEWILHPELLNRNTLYELRTLLARYPYFQTARLLYLKNLYLLHDIAFGEELRKAALFVADRRVLFKLIEGERFTFHFPKKQEQSEDQPGLDRTLSLIDKFLASMPEESASATLPPIDITTDYASYLLREEEKQPSSAEVPPMKGQNLIDDFIERADEEPILSQMGTNDNGLEDVGSPSLDKSEEMLPREVEQTDETNERLREEEPEGQVPEETEEQSYFTETLAKIYVKQHRYSKALEIIKKLNLKYPKKNAYFADQIRFLEKLIINTKSE